MSTAAGIWWVWSVVAVVVIADLAFQGHDLSSLRFGLGVVMVTGFVYACTLWPMVIADESGLTVRNPYRAYAIPWGAVKGIYLADSVEVQCARPEPKKDKTVYCWALYSARSARARARMRQRRQDSRGRGRAGSFSQPSVYDRAPASAQALTKMTQAEVMARELARLSEEAKFREATAGLEEQFGEDAAQGTRGAGSAAETQASIGEVGRGENAPQHGAAAGEPVMVAGWSWQPLVASLAPVVLFVIAMVVR